MGLGMGWPPGSNYTGESGLGFRSLYRLLREEHPRNDIIFAVGKGIYTFTNPNPVSTPTKSMGLPTKSVALPTKSVSTPTKSAGIPWLSQERENVTASRSLAKQSPLKRTKLTFWRLLQAEKRRPRNDLVNLSFLENTIAGTPTTLDIALLSAIMVLILLCHI